MRFHIRKYIKDWYLNPNRFLNEGNLLDWIAEEFTMAFIIHLWYPKIVTMHMAEINIRSLAR
jgi:hypothetical protein